jgi:hypothetical protein
MGQSSCPKGQRSVLARARALDAPGPAGHNDPACRGRPPVPDDPRTSTVKASPMTDASRRPVAGAGGAVPDGPRTGATSDSRRAASRPGAVPRVDAMPIDRLAALLDGIWAVRLGFVVGPPGAGKTTLLASYAARHADRVAWYRADRWDGSEPGTVARLA